MLIRAPKSEKQKTIQLRLELYRVRSRLSTTALSLAIEQERTEALRDAVVAAEARANALAVKLRAAGRALKKD